MPTYPTGVPHVFSPRQVIGSNKVNVDFSTIIGWLTSGTYSANFLDVYINGTNIISSLGAIVNTPSLSLGGDSGIIAYSTSPNYFRVTAKTGFSLSFGSNNTTEQLLLSSGNLGLGTGATISAKAHIISTTEQLRLGYDASNYLSITVGNSGIVTFNAVGASSSLSFLDAVNINGNFSINTNKFNIATSSGNTSIAGTLGVTGATSLSSATISTTLGVTGAASLGSATIAGSLNVTGSVAFDTTTFYVDPTNHNIGIGTATPNGGRILEISKAKTGNLLTRFINTSNAAGTDNAIFEIYTGGTSAGDPGIELGILGGTAYSIGIDNSDGDVLKFSPTAGDVSTNAFFFLDGANGNVGIGTKPNSGRILDIMKSKTGNLTSRLYNTSNAAGTDNAIFEINVGGTSAGDPMIDFIVSGAAAWTVGIDNSDSDKFKISYSDGALGTNDRFIVDSNGNIGIGISGSTTTISAKAHIISTTEQLRLGYDASNYLSFTISSAGIATLAPSGSKVAIIGSLTISNQPKAYVYLTTSLSTTNNVNTNVSMTGEVYDASGMHSTASDTERINILETGTYKIQGRITFEFNATGYRYGAISSDAINELTYVQISADPAYPTQIDLNVPPIELTAGQYVYMTGLQNSGGSLNMSGHATNGKKLTYLSVVKLF